MSTDRATRVRGREPAAAAAVVVLLVLAAVGARQVTTALHDNPDLPAAGTTAGHTVTGSPTPSTDLNAIRRGGDPAPAGSGPVDAGEPVPGVIRVGEVVLEEPFRHRPAPDQVTFEPDAARAVVGALEGTADDTADQPRSTVDSILGVRVGTTGRFATIYIGIGIGSGLPGVVSLAVDFGDGRTLELDDRQLAALRRSGQTTVVHEYRATLTPQPQQVVVTAVDTAGTTHDRTVRFNTRAAFLLTYSALTVTALDRCDVASKGDFELRWRLDARPERRSTFQLGNGDSYLEERFRVGRSGVHYNEPLEHSSVLIQENDAGFEVTSRGFRFDLFQDSESGAPGRAERGPVGELGNHHYQVSLLARDIDHGGSPGGLISWPCDARLDFTVHLALPDRPDR
jgi:hypothetical protein